MSTSNSSGSHAQSHNSKLFILSVIALVTAGMAFSIRGGITSDLQKTFFETIDPANAATRVTAVTGVAFLGFAISVLIGSPLCDFLGMGKLLALSSLLFIGGTLGTVFAGNLAQGEAVGTVLWASMFAIGLAHGLVEAVINPLIATLYPEDKTHKLNVLHAWWPGGIIIGGLLSATGLDWKVKAGIVLLPAIAFGIMLIGTKFPPTERVAAGVSNSAMFSEAFRPLFIVFFLCMFMTAATELAPGQWVDAALTRTVGMRGILLLVYVSGLMFVMRYFAGPLAHKLSPVGLLWFSSALAGVGLVLLSIAHSPVIAILSATVWGVGVCYMWPTMLAVTSERFPKGGAFLMGVMGSAGNLAIYFVLPKLGAIFDSAKLDKAKELGLDFNTLQTAAKSDPTKEQTLNQVLSFASETSFKSVAILPVILLVVFGLIFLYDKSRGGYKAEKLAGDAE